MTIGDILAIIAAIIAVIWTLATSTVLVALAAPLKVDQAAQTLITEPKSVIMRGAALAIVLIVAVGVYHAAALPPVKLILTLLIATLSGFALIGSASVATVISGRINSDLTPFPRIRSLYYGALLCLVAAFAPIVGWLLIAPSLLAITLGAGSVILWPLSRKPATVHSELQAQGTILS